MLTLGSTEFCKFLAQAQLLSPWRLSCTCRGAWIKIIKLADDGTPQDMPFCFIERSTGIIFRAANWRFPAKKFPRGNLYDADNGVSQITPEGVQFLKSGCPKGYKYDHARKTPVRTKKPKQDRETDEVEFHPLISIPVDPPFIPYPRPLPVRVHHETTGNFWGAEENM